MFVKWFGCIFTLLLILKGLVSVSGHISDLRRCADLQCKEPISKGLTVIGYPSNDAQILSFPINADVIVYSKEAGIRKDLWGVEIKGKRGYAPKQYIREHKVFILKLEYEVPTEGLIDHDAAAVDKNKKKNVDESLKESNAKLEVTEEKIEPPVDEITLSGVDEITLSGEDVEYNHLKKADSKKQEDSLKDDIDANTKAETKDERIMQGGEEGKELQDDNWEAEEKEEEEDDDDGDEDGDENGEEDVDEDGEEKIDEEELEQVAPDATDSEIADTEGDEIKGALPSKELFKEQDSKVEDDDEGKDAGSDPETSTEFDESLTLSDMPADDEASPANYEVIDGTTLYIDDVTPLPPTAEYLTPVNLMSSSVMKKDYTTAHPPPLLPKSSQEGIHDHSSSIQVTPTLHPTTSTAIVMESGSESVVTDAPIEPTETLPHAEDTLGRTEVERIEQSVDPAASWFSDATASVTSWFGDEEKEDQSEVGKEEEEPRPPLVGDDTERDGFGKPNDDPLLDGSEITDEEDKQDDGYFSSWFGSSEAVENEDIHNESSEDLATTKSEEAINEQAAVEPDSQPEISSTEASKANPVDTPLPSDTIPPTPVEPSDSPVIFAQPPYTAADDVDHAYDTQYSPLPSVDVLSETTPDLARNPENPLDYGDAVLVEDPSGDLKTASISTQTDLADDTGDDEDPGTSTARPLYAVPEPTSQDYHSDNHVDPDDLSRLAGKGAVMDGSESLDDDPADVSLIEGLLKTSHNLWLAISGALQLPEGLAFGFEAEVAEPQVSSGMLVFLLMVSGTVVTIYLVHLVMLKMSREAPLLAALNRIDHENRIKANENDTLHADLVKAHADLETVVSRVTISSGDVVEINSQLELVKNEYASEKNQLEDRVMQLEHELEEATTNGIEMHKMLSEMLSAQKDASAFQASVDHLQAMLDGQREKVETLTSDLALKSRLNDELHNELSSSMERTSKLDYQVEQLTHSLEDLTGIKGEAIRKLQEEAALVVELKQANVSLTQQTVAYNSKVSSLTNELSELHDTINQLRESVETKQSELQVAKECLKQLRLTSSNDATAPDEEKLSALFDVIKVKAELRKVNNERVTLVEHLHDAEMAQTNLEDTMASIRTEVAELRTHHDAAIREKQEAMSKLEVLTKYFEEKEAQLTKELESQEGLRVTAEGSAAAVSKKNRNYELEMASYKTQAESLRKELEEQESSYKTQISSQEQKAHENWLQARTAERKHEEQRQENSQLRSRITMMQKEKEEAQQAQVNIIKPTPKRVDANGTMSSPRPMVDGVDGDHSGPPSLHHDLDSPPIPPHPMHGPPMLSMMFPPGHLPPGVPPPHGLPLGVHPPPGLPHGVPPPHHGLPHHPFLPGEPPFMGPLPPLPGDCRLPPAGGISSPPFRRTGSPSYDHRNDGYSSLSDRSHISDRRYSPPPRRRPLSPDMHRNRSPDRRSDRTRSPDRRDRMLRSPDHRNRRSPEHDGYMRHRNSPRNYYDEPEFHNDNARLRSHLIKGKKTSTPLGPNDR